MSEPSLFFRAIVAFNAGSIKTLFADDNDPPAGVTPIVALLDWSGSIAGHMKEARQLYQSFILGSNAEGEINSMEKPSDRTNLVATVNAFSHKIDGCDLLVMTDGCENTYTGVLDIPQADGTTRTVDFGSMSNTSREYIANVAAYLMGVCGANLYYLGLGLDSAKMAEVLLRKTNVHVARIDACSPEETRSLVKGLFRRGREQRALPLAERTRQEAPLVVLSPEVQQILKAMDQEEIRRVSDACTQMVVRGIKIEEDLSNSHVIKSKFAKVETEILKTLPVDKLWFARTAAILIMQAMVETPLPLAAFTGARCGVLEFPNKTYPKYLNTLFSRLVAEGVTIKAGVTGEDGAKVAYGEGMVQVPKGAAMYKSAVPVTVLDELSKDHTHFCEPVSMLKFRASCKRKRSEEKEGEEEGEEGAKKKKEEEQ